MLEYTLYLNYLKILLCIGWYWYCIYLINAWNMNHIKLGTVVSIYNHIHISWLISGGHFRFLLAGYCLKFGQFYPTTVFPTAMYLCNRICPTLKIWSPILLQKFLINLHFKDTNHIYSFIKLPLLTTTG